MTSGKPRFALARLFALLALAACSPPDEGRPAPGPSTDPGMKYETLAIDPDRITVSGLSAGGMMAHRLHVAYSGLFSGAAALAAGPYGCADGSLKIAMAR